jgi:hypothetical protein
VRCKRGRVSRSTRIPANKGTKERHYTLTLHTVSKVRVTDHMKVVVAGIHTTTTTSSTTTTSTTQLFSPSKTITIDPQSLQATINPGTITITTPYTASNTFVLPAMTLSSDGTYLQSTATFPTSTESQIVVTSALAPADAWTLSVSATPLTSGVDQIPASGFGLTGGTLLNGGPGAGDYSGAVSFTNIPALNPSPADSAGTGPGLSATPQTFAESTAADGTADIEGRLTLYAATDTPAGTYTGTISFSVS